jgi:hypothetical protein
MRKMVVLVCVYVMMLWVHSVFSKPHLTQFGVLFPELPRYEAPDDAALFTLTAAGTTTAPGPLFDQNLDQDDNPDRAPSFFTYFGQFVDHDMTLDLTSLPTGSTDSADIENNRDQRFNLDSVFGSRYKYASEIYEADEERLKSNGLDLARRADGTAIIADGRNDENQVIAQIHLLFIRAYNRLIDGGMRSDLARNEMEYRYQWILVKEFLPEILDPDVYSDVFHADGSIVTRFFDPNRAAKADMPVEFSVAAYRFGHSVVRRAYVVTQGGPKLQVFNGTANDLHGGRPIALDHTIFWPNFLNVDGLALTGLNGAPTNVSRKIDTLLSSGLFNLPIPGVAPAGTNILALRNLQRGRGLGLPSGQSIASRMGIPVLTNAEIVDQIPRLSMLLDQAYLNQTPLWLYILAESEIVHGGRKIGPVGSRIIAEVIGGLLVADNRSFYRRRAQPNGGLYRAQDLLREASVLPALP